MKKNFIAGFLIGALIFGSGAAYAATVIATPTTSPVYVNGKQINVTAYNINGNNYFKLRDLGAAIDFGVTYDNSTKIINIDTTAPYVEETSSNSTGAMRVPQSDMPFRPAAGTVILTDTGETYTITKLKPEEPALPTATCDWSQFPEPELPKVTAQVFHTEDNLDVLSVFNLYETRRIQYDLYNLIAVNPATWESGKVKTYTAWKSDIEYPVVTIYLGLSPNSHDQAFWPYRQSEVKKVFESAPLGEWYIAAYDQYINGEYHTTHYYIDK